VAYDRAKGVHRIEGLEKDRVQASACDGGVTLASWSPKAREPNFDGTILTQKT
jgi:hypothetical protein